MLKKVSMTVHPYEAEIGRYLCSESLACDPRNHCCPTWDVLSIPGDEDQVILVMPLLREYNDPRFTTVGEAVGFFRQIFEV